MKPAFSEKNEITVIGYGEAKNKTLTGATSKVDGEDIEKMNMSRMDQALQGQMAGVNISTNSGSPGGSANIRIRGLGTFGDNDPLILVDGIVYDSQGLNALNPSDIKSITVLKDAMAGIYGVRAANGVVLIETKNGAINRKPTIEYNGYFGLQETSKNSTFSVLTNMRSLKMKCLQWAVRQCHLTMLMSVKVRIGKTRYLHVHRYKAITFR